MTIFVHCSLYTAIFAHNQILNDAKRPMISVSISGFDNYHLQLWFSLSHQISVDVVHVGHADTRSSSASTLLLCTAAGI